MIRYAWYAVKVTTACEVPCCVKQFVFLADVKSKNANIAS
jgi:hypothetical protein